MRFSLQGWLGAGLLLAAAPKLASADLTAKMDIWSIDPTCDDYDLQGWFNEALVMANNAIESLQFVLLKQPDQKKDPDAFDKWNHIFSAVASTLGIRPNKRVEEKESDPYWVDAFRIYRKIVVTLQANVNDPEKGWVQDLADRPNAKPKLICGETPDKAFKWYNWDDESPDEAPTQLYKMDKFKEYFNKGGMGAWYNDGRYIWKKKQQGTPILCEGNTLAAVHPWYDLIHICPSLLTSEHLGATTPTALRNGAVKANDYIDDASKFPSATILHELTHFYGGLKNPPSTSKLNVEDKTAVDRAGVQLFDNAKRIKTYGYAKIRYLAMPETPGNRANRDNFGPKVAIFNADSLTYFSLLAYINKADYVKRKGFADLI